MIFQEPMSSLNPVYNIGFQIIEAIRLHQDVSETQAKRKAISLLQEVKLLPTDRDLELEYRENNSLKNPQIRIFNNILISVNRLFSENFPTK